MLHKAGGYASDLTDAQWGLIEALIPVYEWGRPRKLDMRSVVNALLYLAKTGCQWHMLPREYPNSNSVYHHFRQWSRAGAWEAINTALREQVRVQDGRDAQPSAGSIDSQSVKTTQVGGEAIGFDGGKQVNGRKRHILVDTMGNLIKVICSTAQLADSKGAMQVLTALPTLLWTNMQRIWADGGYRGALVDWLKDNFKVILDITLRSDDQAGFQVIPWRWVVERTFAWLSTYRRLSKDYEFFCETSQSMIYLASIHRLLRRLAPARPSAIHFKMSV